MDEDKLMQLDIKDGKAQTPVTYDTDVGGYKYFGGDIFYFKNYDEENGVGDLYKNKEKIDDDVVVYGIIAGSDIVTDIVTEYMKNSEMFDAICVEEDKVYYFKDRDSEPYVELSGYSYEDIDTKANTASLMVYCDGKTEVVASDVNALDEYQADGKLYYETNYDENEKTSTVYCIEDGESVKVLDDVYELFVLKDGTCYYMANYDDKYAAGDLYLHGEKENKLIATDVQQVITPNSIRISD
jgi:predicted glutamine amidotransferase